MNGGRGSFFAPSRPSKSGVGVRLTLAFVAFALLCVWAVAQEDSADYWYNKSGEPFVNGSLEESVEAFNKAIEFDPQNAEAWRYRALTLRDLGEYDEAIAAFDRAIELDPQNTEAKVEKAGTLIVVGRQAEALAIFDELTAEVPEDPEERLRQSSAWAEQGERLRRAGALERVPQSLREGDRSRIGIR